MTLTATVTSATNQIASGATVAFSQTTTTTVFGHTTTRPRRSPGAQRVQLVRTGAGRSQLDVDRHLCDHRGVQRHRRLLRHLQRRHATSSSQANLGQTNTLTPSVSYGANSQTNAGGCSGCYYGETSTPTPRATHS